MNELRDSAVVVDDPATLHARLDEDGYLFFRELIDPAEVLAVRRDVLHAIAQCGWLAGGLEDASDALGHHRPRKEFIDGEDGTRRTDPAWYEGYKAIYSLESFHRLAHSPRLLEVANAVIGQDAFPCPGGKIARVTWPATEDFDNTVPAHQDFTHVQGTADLVTAWVPLGSCPRELGGLKVLAGSARGGIRPTEVLENKAGGGLSTSGTDPRDPDWATTEYGPGDVLLFHCLTVHAAQPNRTRHLRLSADYRFQSAAQPMNRHMVSPQTLAFAPPQDPTAGWPFLTQGWSSTRWIETPDLLELTDAVARQSDHEQWSTQLMKKFAPPRLVRVDSWR